MNGSRRSEVSKGCEVDGMKRENFPAYVRGWMDKEAG
jgi:hypothetical protein